MPQGPRRVLVVAYPAAEIIDIACVVSSLNFANLVQRKTIYEVSLASLGGRPVDTATGLTIAAQERLEQVTGPLDTMIVVGGTGYVDAMDNRQLVAHVRRLSAVSRRVASVCTGAGVLAAAGLLDGRRAATHWFYAASLSARYPQVDFDSAPISVTDGAVSTSAGVTAALDLVLSFIDSDVSPQLARDVSRQLVTYLHRPGNQAQMSMFTAPAARDCVVSDAVDYIGRNPAADLSTAALAERAGLSVRHFSRLFMADAGLTPGRFVRVARAEAAALLLTGTNLTMPAIAARCGFRSHEALRQTFQDLYGVSPSQYRATQSTLTAASAM